MSLAPLPPRIAAQKQSNRRFAAGAARLSLVTASTAPEPPTAEGATQGRSTQQARERVQGKCALDRQVLLVEDESIVREVVRRMLESLGYKPLIASSAAEALRILASEPVDLLLSDVIMPDMRGPELYASARGNLPALDALFVSGYSEDVLAEVPLHEPGVGFLPKPFTVSELGDALSTLLERDDSAS